jgi:hypothetical protein
MNSVSVFHVCQLLLLHHGILYDIILLLLSCTIILSYY